MQSKIFWGMCLAALSRLDPASAAVAAGTETTAKVSVLEEIVVTAQKREERLNDVGMSLTVVSGDELKSIGVTTPDELAKVTPGFVAARSAYGVPIYTLRGIGFYDYSLGATPAVSVYVDQIPLPYSQMTEFATLDLERVEVLKGPQGTLYGLNSTAGAVNFIAAKPTKIFDVQMSLTGASYNEFDAQGHVSGPLSDTLSYRLAASTEQGGGWQKSITRGDANGDKRKSAARLLLDWQPTEDFATELNLNYGVDKSDSMALQFQQVTPLNPTNAALLAARPLLYNTPPAGNDARAADWDSNEKFRINNKNWQAALTASYNLSDSLTVKSLSSYQDFTADSRFDGDGTPLYDFQGDIDGRARAFFQELGLYGTSTKLSWIVGANYIYDHVYEGQFGYYPYSSLALRGSSASFTDSDQRADTWAAFGSADYELTNTLKLQAGVRYTDSQRRFQGCSRAPDAASAAFFSVLFRTTVPVGGCATAGPSGAPQLITSKLDEDNVAWRVGINWKYQPDALLYANVSRGFKGGSYPLLTAVNYAQLAPVRQENVLAYEVGFKNAFGQAAQLNGAVFYYDYADKQIRGRYVDPIFGPLSALVNVPKSKIYGAELEAIVRPFTGLTVRGSGTYVKSKILGGYSNYDFLGGFQSFDGEALPFTPKFTGNLAVDYEHALTSSLDGFIGAGLNHNSAMNAGLGELSIARIDAFTTVDLSAGLRANDERWSLRVWGRNVTNEYHWNSVIMVLDAVARSPSPPATYGVTFDLKY